MKPAALPIELRALIPGLLLVLSDQSIPGIFADLAPTFVVGIHGGTKSMLLIFFQHFILGEKLYQLLPARLSLYLNLVG